MINTESHMNSGKFRINFPPSSCAIISTYTGSTKNFILNCYVSFKRNKKKTHDLYTKCNITFCSNFLLFQKH